MHKDWDPLCVLGSFSEVFQACVVQHDSVAVKLSCVAQFKFKLKLPVWLADHPLHMPGIAGTATAQESAEVFIYHQHGAGLCYCSGCCFGLVFALSHVVRHLHAFGNDEELPELLPFVVIPT